MEPSCGMCMLSREINTSYNLCPIHGDGGKDEVQDYVWKVEFDETLIPPVSYYISDEVAARDMELDDRQVTIISLEE